MSVNFYKSKVRRKLSSAMPICLWRTETRQIDETRSQVRRTRWRRTYL